MENRVLVDIVHHALIGFGGALVAQSTGSPEAGIGFLLGSILPDLDIVFLLGGKTHYLRLHQGVTHSILVAPFLAAAVALPLASSLSMDGFVIWAGAVAGILLHVILDCLNTFGVRALWPHPRRIALDAFFFVDVPALSVTTVALMAMALAPNWSAVAVALAWSSCITAYSRFRFVIRRNIRRRYTTDTEVPSGIFPTRFFVTRTEESEIRMGVSKGLDPYVTWTSSVPVPSEDTLRLARKSGLFRELESSLRRFMPVRRIDGNGTTVVIARCIAVPNFGNQYGEAELVFQDEELKSEAARI